VIEAPVMPATSPPRSMAPVRVLAAVEGRRALRHPVFLAFGALGLLYTLLAVTGFGESNAGGDESFLLALVSGFGCMTMAVGTFMSVNLAVLRSRRDRTQELFAAAPVGEPLRVGAHLVSILGPVLGAVGMVVIVFFLSGALDGHVVHFVDGPRDVRVGASALLQGPAVVLVGGSLGAAAGRWIPHPAFNAVVVALAVPQMIAVSWMVGGAGSWFAPLVQPLYVADWIDASPTYSYPVVVAVETAALGWHLLYIAGIGVAAAGAALARGYQRAWPRAIVAGGVVLATAGGILQLAVLTT